MGGQEAPVFDPEKEADKFISARLPPPAKSPPGKFLLSGATGFLGRYVLCALLDFPASVVYCLVRGRSRQAAAERLRERLMQHGLWIEAVAGRIEVIPANLAAAGLGIDDSLFSTLAENVDSIVHVGAMVNSLLPYDLLAKANVQGTGELLRLSASGWRKPFHYISTVSADPVGPFVSDSGYARTKWHGEQLVTSAQERGIPTAIYRVPRISGATSTGYWNERDMMARLVHTTLSLGVAPDLAFEEDWIPVDSAARALALMATRPVRGERRLLAASHPVRFARVLELARQDGRKVAVVPALDWLALVRDRKPEEHALMAPLLEFALRVMARGDVSLRHRGFSKVIAGGVTDDILQRYMKAGLQSAC